MSKKPKGKFLRNCARTPRELKIAGTAKNRTKIPNFKKIKKNSECRNESACELQESKKSRDGEKQNENFERRKEIPNAVEVVIPKSEKKLNSKFRKKIKYFEGRRDAGFQKKIPNSENSKFREFQKYSKLIRPKKNYAVRRSARCQIPKKNSKFRKFQIQKFQTSKCVRENWKNWMALKKSRGTGLDSWC